MMTDAQEEWLRISLELHRLDDRMEELENRLLELGRQLTQYQKAFVELELKWVLDHEREASEDVRS